MPIYEEYPDMRYHEERRQYEYYKSLDYSKCKDWSVLFSTHIEYVNALNKMSHPFHKEAVIIKNNRFPNGMFPTGNNEPSMGEDAYWNYRFLG